MRNAAKTGRLAGSATALALAVGSLATADQGSAAVAPAPADDRGAWQDAVQNNPNDGTKDDIHQRIAGLVNGSPAGSTITAASYHLDDDMVGKALVAAAGRNVRLRLLIDGHDTEKPAYKDVDKAINNQDDSVGSSIKHCGTGKSSAPKQSSCMGDHIMHNKFFLFQRPSRPPVVVQTSANLNAHSGPEMWNTAYFSSEPWLLRSYLTYFNDLASTDPSAPKPVNSDYYAKSPPENGKFRLSFSPRAHGNTMLDALHSVRCSGNSSGGTDDGRTIVRVAAMHIVGSHGQALAKQLRDLDNSGCYVDVVAGDLPRPKRDGPKQPLSYLLEQPKGKYHGPEVRSFSPTQCSVHQKNILIDGYYDGKPNQKVVITGSHNMNNKSPRNNDETVLQIKDPAMHQKFKQFFFTLRANAAITWQTSKFDVVPKRDPKFNCG